MTTVNMISALNCHSTIWEWCVQSLCIVLLLISVLCWFAESIKGMLISRLLSLLPTAFTNKAMVTLSFLYGKLFFIMLFHEKLSKSTLFHQYFKCIYPLKPQATVLSMTPPFCPWFTTNNHLLNAMLDFQPTIIRYFKISNFKVLCYNFFPQFFQMTGTLCPNKLLDWPEMFWKSRCGILKIFHLMKLSTD